MRNTVQISQYIILPVTGHKVYKHKNSPTTSYLMLAGHKIGTIRKLSTCIWEVFAGTIDNNRKWNLGFVDSQMLVTHR